MRRPGRRSARLGARSAAVRPYPGQYNPLMVIAIDGPGASGKSTVGDLVARHLGYRFIDTGGMYRALTWLALSRDLDFEDEKAIADLAQGTSLTVVPGDADFPHGR